MMLIANDSTRHRRSKSLRHNESKFFAPLTPPVPPPRTGSGFYQLKPRRNVGDRVCVSSTSKVYLEYADSNAKVAKRLLEQLDEDNEEEEEEDYEEKGRVIRRCKDVPKIRNRIFEESLESQEITFYIGDEDGHHYESLYAKDEEVEEDYDSFESGTESEYSKDKLEIEDLNDADVQNNKLPDAPQNHQSLMKSAGRNVKKIGRNFTLNLTNTFTRMKKHISKIESDRDTSKKNTMLKPKLPVISIDNGETTSVFEPSLESPNDETTKTLTRNKEGFLTKFRRSMSLSAESANEVTSSLTKTKSTFYLTDTIHVDEIVKTPSPQAVLRHKSPLARPKHPPPPVPLGEPHRKDKTTSWYADSGLFRNKELPPKRPNTCWYAEVGLYRGQNSTPSTSSAENSGSNSSSTIKPIDIDVGRPVLNKSTQDFINHDDNESYNNLKNEDFLYNGSVNSFGSNETKKDESLKQDIQLWLQEEPLYQFYDAALLEATNYSNSSDFDSDNYEDVPPKIKIRPSAMELVSPKRDSICFTKTLWCEIPEVINSAVLSTLNVHQRKLQEAKFEILTSEASYLNSLNVLSNHFYKNFTTGQVITTEERDVLFGNVEAVRNCSEKLLLDLERCWQDNILLHGICKIVQKHAEENFSVYVPYCENQILFDDVLKKLKERSGFTEFLKHLEQSEACQSLTLYSFLMLPMQRITRWPLLIDAVLKRLPENDPEYYTCQYTLATLNKIVSQCNEAARQKERINELLKVAKQLEFPEFMTPIPIVTPERWLVRCGSITHIQLKNEDAKLTFGKRSTKLNLNLFLFNDLFVVAKEKGSSYVVQQYCPRNMVELSTTDVMLTVPAKEVQNKNLIFLTILENHEGKTVEYLFSCNCESDKERWVKALTPPKSENPEEILYECWDCPQVSAIHSYTASQPDELALTKGDVINVLRKMDDGWYHGERLRDGLTGWFPANYTVEIANFHVRARNLKQRYRLLAFSENYLKSK
ncbi:hypothetical protein ABEB36_012985 [Hypothenemus hampei]|uniref:Rho guanine nucleotide exchange factor 26 n=1 Tax=Hypothenemus hampei TaxID=57062 RepID=A0ABD1E6Q5_HYPHA